MPTNTKISVMTADSSHFTSLIELGITYYPPDHPVLTEAFLQWFYLDNPAGPATLVVAHEEGEWIGLIVLIPVLLGYKGCPQDACYAVNVLTHPKHREKRLFVKMISHARDYLSREGRWLLGHPNANAVPGWQRQKMAFRDPMHLYLAKWRLPFSSLRENRIENLDQLQVIPEAFWESLACRPDVHLTYTPEFIYWRFIDAPHRDYIVSLIENHGELLGFRVTRRFKGPVDLMVDFIAPSTSIGALVSTVRRPTLVMHSGLGISGNEVNKGCWKLPLKRQFLMFVTTWEQTTGVDMSGITLSASDF